MRPQPGAGPGADLIIRNAKIFTGDPTQPAATAVAITDGVFVAVGDDADIAPHLGTGTRVVDALNRRVIPGLNDSHTHAIRGGNNYLMELRWTESAACVSPWTWCASKPAEPPRVNGCGLSAVGAQSSSPKNDSLR